MTCDNTQSHLTINFGDVYLTSGNALYAGSLSGEYVGDDSNVLEFSSDPSCTSIDMTAVTNLPATLPWLEGSNRVVYVKGESELTGTNVVKDSICASLVLNEAWGTFRPAKSFGAIAASYTCVVDGQHIVQLPFQALVPTDAIVYLLTDDLKPVAVSDTVPANQPVVIEAQGEVTFLGKGEVRYMACPLSDEILPISTPTGIFAISSDIPVKEHRIYDLQGRMVKAQPREGLYIKNGRKYLIK